MKVRFVHDKELVDRMGLEPTTSAMRLRRSLDRAIGPRLRLTPIPASPFATYEPNTPSTLGFSCPLSLLTSLRSLLPPGVKGLPGNEALVALMCKLSPRLNAGPAPDSPVTSAWLAAAAASPSPERQACAARSTAGTPPTARERPTSASGFTSFTSRLDRPPLWPILRSAVR